MLRGRLELDVAFGASPSLDGVLPKLFAALALTAAACGLIGHYPCIPLSGALWLSRCAVGAMSPSGKRLVRDCGGVWRLWAPGMVGEGSLQSTARFPGLLLLRFTPRAGPFIDRPQWLLVLPASLSEADWRSLRRLLSIDGEPFT
ncbi:MAG: hypothetical protein AAGG55_11720 [Pseudomonadota bacterium]